MTGNYGVGTGTEPTKWQAEESARLASVLWWANGCKYPLGTLRTLEGRQWRIYEATHATETRPEYYRLRLVTAEPFPSTKEMRLADLESYTTETVDALSVEARR